MLGVRLFCFYLTTISSVLGARKIGKSKTTTSNPLSSFLDSFHQNDYEMTFEWAEIVRQNTDFGKYTATVFKYNRTTTAINFTLSVNADLGYDVEVIVQAYKFASNEYRVFPIHFEVNFCDAITRQILGSNRFAKNGNFSCPLLKGRHYIIFNWCPDAANLPPFIPTGKYMLELQYLFQTIEILVTRNYGSIYRPITVYEG